MKRHGAHHKPDGAAQTMLLQYRSRKVNRGRAVVSACQAAVPAAREVHQQGAVAGAQVEDTDVLPLQMKQGSAHGRQS